MLFRSKEAIAAWCAAQQRPPGALLTLPQTWALAQAWYHARMDAAYRGRSLAEAEVIFRALGLDGPFWQADPTRESGE